MADHYSSCHSIMLLNVSEDHASTISSPVSTPDTTAVVHRSPLMRAEDVRRDDSRTDATEVIEDSYKESIRNDAQPHRSSPALQDSGDELYDLSPKAKAILDTRLQANKVAHPEQRPASPSRNPIEMFLEDGAMAVTKPQATSSHGPPTSQRTNSKVSRTRAVLLEKVQPVTKGVDVSSEGTGNAAHAPFKAPDRDGHKTFEEMRSNVGGYELEKSQTGVNYAISPRENEKEKSSFPGQQCNVPTASDTGISRANGTKDRNQTTCDKTILAPSRKPVKRQLRAGTEPRSPLQQEQVLPTTTSGRPQRKAKQTALAKLRSKYIETDDDELAQTVDELGSDTSTWVTRQVKTSVVKKRREREVQLPKSAPNDLHSKQKQTVSARGKVRSTKANALVLKTIAKTKPAAAPTALQTVPDSAIDEIKVKAPSTTESPASAVMCQTEGSVPDSLRLPDHRQRNERPGALKRPARSASRGRNLFEVQSVYEAPENVVQTTKPKRSPAKALKPSKTRIQPTRQRMQSQSNKEQPRRIRVMHVNSQPPSSEESFRSLRAINRDGKGKSHPLKDSQVGEPSGSDHSSFQSKQNNDDQTIKPGQSEVTGPQAALEEKAGSSQTNAIMIHQSDKSGSSSSAMTPIQAIPATTHASHAVRVLESKGRPQTPFALPSSPPGPTKRSEYRPVPDKPTIIAFGKDRPRNQGFASIRKSLPLRDWLNDEKGHSNALLIRDATNVSAKTPFPACLNDARNILAPTLQGTRGLSNRSQRIDDVFEAFTQNGKNSALAKMPRSDCGAGEIVDHSNKIRLDPVSQIEDLEGPTLVEEDCVTSFAHKLRTASQVAMPPPERAGLKHKTGNRESFNSSKRGDQHSSQRRLKRGTESLPGSVSKKAKTSQATQNGDLHRSDSPGIGPFTLESPHAVETAPTKDDQGAVQGRGRRTRRSARDSNGVDLLGSPYPKNLHVPKQATALEVFSQQTSLSSDRPSVSDDRGFPGLLGFAPPPNARSSVELRRMSNNRKLRSSADQEASTSLLKTASDTLTQRLLKANSPINATVNPFITSQTCKSTGVGAMSELAEKLRQRGFTSSEDHVEEDQNLAEHDDAGQTLVDLVHDRESGIKGITSSPASSKASDSSADPDAERIIEDVGDWRNTLRPHQTRLFDSLVVASHKLVRHMVDKDTADRDIVADYRRRGEIIIVELQRAQTREYEQYLTRMQVWKREAAKKLDAYANELSKRAKDAERAKIEQQKAKRSWNEVQKAFSKLLEG